MQWVTPYDIPKDIPHDFIRYSWDSMGYFIGCSMGYSIGIHRISYRIFHRI
jgi:hypothetical protein